MVKTAVSVVAERNSDLSNWYLLQVGFQTFLLSFSKTTLPRKRKERLVLTCLLTLLQTIFQWKFCSMKGCESLPWKTKIFNDE